MAQDNNQYPAPHGPSADAAAAHADLEWPQPSIWPLATALAVAIALVGMLVGPPMVVAGALLTLACVVAWGVEGGEK